MLVSHVNLGEGEVEKRNLQTHGDWTRVRHERKQRGVEPRASESTRRSACAGDALAREKQSNRGTHGLRNRASSDLPTDSSTQGEKDDSGRRFSICRFDEWVFYYDVRMGIFPYVRICVLVDEAERCIGKQVRHFMRVNR